MNGRRSYEAGPVPASRLHKQRSNHGLRAASHGQPFSMSSSSKGNASRMSALPSALGDGTRARKGSIRNAVRKMFGRARDSMSQAPADVETTTASPRHAYHKSEPPAPLPAQPELPEPQVDDDVVMRTLSHSYQADRPSFSRTTSPYALQFPHSVRLKPMDLSSHYSSPPQALRRRKTLPNMLPENGDTTGDTPTAEDSETEPVPRQDKTSGDNNTVKSGAERVKKDRRKSRSTDDLQAVIARDQSVPRKRSEEIRYWRESLQTDTLRASGFTTQSRSRDRAAIMRPNISRGSERASTKHEQEDEVVTARPPTSEQYGGHSKPATLKSSPPRQHGAASSFTDDDHRPLSGGGTEMSRDLEDRVAKLEAGLQNFQKSLQKLTADRNRRTIVMGGSVATKASSADMRTPSLLADTLADALEPSGYEYEYGHTIRPSLSSQPPIPASVQGHVDDPFGPELSTPAAPASHPGPLTSHVPSLSQTSRKSELRARPDHDGELTPQTTSATMAAVTPGTNASGGTAQPQQYTFRSLYQMLADERSARRKLENQLKGLRQEISDLHSQVNSTSNQQSTRSSYMLAGSSSRLQDILRETGESSPPDASPRSLKRQSALSAQSSGGAPLFSRFSGSDSEALTQEFSQLHDDLDTPYSDYRTPREERSNWSLAEKIDVNTKHTDMF